MRLREVAEGGARFQVAAELTHLSRQRVGAEVRSKPFEARSKADQYLSASWERNQINYRCLFVHRFNGPRLGSLDIDAVVTEIGFQLDGLELLHCVTCFQEKGLFFGWIGG